MMRTSYMLPDMLRRWSRAGALAVMLGATTALTACEQFLAADNPGAIQVERLADTALVELMANSAISGVQDDQSGGNSNTFWYNWMSSIFTDELFNTHTFAEERTDWDQRRVTLASSYNAVFLYGPIARARWLADSLAGRIRTIYGPNFAAAPDSALRDARLARTYAMVGYNMLRLAEGFCEAPIPVGGELYVAPSTSEQIFEMAAARFDSAIKVAAASKTANAAAGGATSRWALAADSIRNLAYIGKARALLGRNDLPGAAAAARQVTGMGSSNDFTYWLYFNATTTLGLHNLAAERLSGGGGVTSGAISFTPFLGLDDPRVPHPINDTTGLPQAEPTQTASYVVPNAPPSFSVYDGTAEGADFTYGTAVRLASLLEARYIIAEAEGPTATNIAFIESRRLAFPSSTAQTPTTAANFMTNLIQQRSRDFFLDGHRIGDLRRWDKYRSIDLWPKGAYPTRTNETYGSQKCWPLVAAEVTNNPFVPKPYTPPMGP